MQHRTLPGTLYIRTRTNITFYIYTPREMEGVPEAGLLPLLGREGLDRLQVEVVVQVEVAQALAVDEEVEHVIPLPAHLESHLNPVQLRLRVLVQFGLV